MSDIENNKEFQRLIRKADFPTVDEISDLAAILEIKEVYAFWDLFEKIQIAWIAKRKH